MAKLPKLRFQFVHSLADQVLDDPAMQTSLQTCTDIVAALPDADQDTKKSLQHLLNIHLQFISATLTRFEHNTYRAQLEEARHDA